MSGFIVGGVVYRSMVHTEHLGSVMQLAAASLLDNSLEFLGLDYWHSSNLPTARARWLCGQVASEATWAVSVDSDSEFDGSALHAYMAMASRRADNDLFDPPAIVVVPMLCGGGAGNLNVVMGDVRQTVGVMRSRFHSEKPTAAITAGGFGVAAFYLPWFRRRWLAPTPERSSIDSDFGEDIDMCLAVGRRGGRIGAVPVNSKHHDLISADRSSLSW